MAQLERRKKLSDSSKSPNSQTSPASDQLLRVDEAYWAANTPPSSGKSSCHDHVHEECPSSCPSHYKKSVLAKVKETAKKLKHSLSGRRKHLDLHDHDHDHDLHLHDDHDNHHRHLYTQIRSHDHHDDHRHTHTHARSHDHDDHRHTHTHAHSHDHDDHNSQSQSHDEPQIHSYEHQHDHVNPCWTATLEDDYLNEKDYDPEYLGAPMYESEAAPDCLKETARQHPRAVPVVSESHRAPNMAKLEASQQENDDVATPQWQDTEPFGQNMITNMTQTVSEKLAPAINTNMITNMTQTVSDKLAPACAAVSDATHQINTEMITNVTGTVSEKLGPACAAVSDATHQIANKLAGITLSAPETQQQAHETSGYSGNLMQCASGSPQTWDKGVSVKEYFLHKLEPGEDERALSQAITEAISPRKSTGDPGMVDKVKGAVTSLFWQDASDSTEGLSSAALASSDISRTVQLNRADSIRTEKPSSPSPVVPVTSDVPLTADEFNHLPSVHVRSSKILSMESAISSPNIPLSSNALEAYEEENHGKILQTN